MELKAQDGVKVKDLLSGQTFQTNLHPDSPIRVTIPAQSGVILNWEI
jgi:hypothetical protein